MVGGVLHDVVHERADVEGKGQVHRGGHKRLGTQPLRLLVIPSYLWMGMVNINHKANHSVPKQEWDSKASN